MENCLGETFISAVWSKNELSLLQLMLRPLNL